jgi:hypothetical protein
MSTTQGDRIVIGGYHAGSHFPREQRTIDLRIELNGTTPAGPFDVAGSIYGRDLRVIGPGSVNGPVLVRGDAQFGASKVGYQVFRSGLFVNGNLQTSRCETGLFRNVPVQMQLPNRIIRGDVVATNAVLEDVLVFGNVEANHVRLERSVVFGAVIARERAQILASTVLYYHSPIVEFEGPCMMIHAMGESIEPPSFAPYQAPDGTVWDADVRLYPVLRSAGYPGLLWRPEVSHKYELKGKLYDGVDWVHVGVSGPKGSNGSRSVLSIAGRALDFGSLADHLNELCTLLRTGLEYAHYTSEAKREAHEKWQKLRPVERAMMSVVCPPMGVPS